MDSQLSLPDVKRYGNTFILTWVEGVTIRLEGLYEHRDRHVDAEVTITDDQDLNPHLLGPQRITITRSFRNTLSDLEDVSARPDWKHRLTQTAHAVLGAFREGQPLIKLSDQPSPTSPTYRISPIVFEGMPSLIFGPGGIGKSMLALYLATLTQGGMSQDDRVTTLKGNVLFLDYETSWEETWRRSSDINAGLGLENDHMVYYRFCAQPLANEVEHLQRQIAELDISLVVVDSAGPACGGEPEGAAPTLQYFSALRALSDYDRPVSTLTIAHVTKESSSKSPFGSVYWTNLPRTTWELKKAQRSGDSHIDVALHHRKVNIGSIEDPIGFRMAWDRGLKVSGFEVAKHKSLSTDLSMPKRAKEIIMENGPMAIKELAEALDIDNERSLTASLSRDSGFFTNDENKWCISEW